MRNSAFSFYRSLKHYLQDKKPYIVSYVPSKNGQIFEIWTNKLGRMVAKSPMILEEEIIEKFEFGLPLIPGKILRQVYSFFLELSEIDEVEVMLQLFYDTEREEYILDCPNQSVSKISVNYRTNSRFQGRNSIRYIEVAQMHSHNTMNAYFSQTDDQDEQSFKIYGVFGGLGKKKPECLFRVKANTTSMNISISQIFDDTSIGYEEYPKEWLSNVYINK